jgi:hypothetical protein
LPGNHTADGGLPAVGCLFSFMYNGKSMHTHNFLPKSISISPWLSHVIVALAIIVSTIGSYIIWYGSDPSDDWARRWVLVAIPFVSAFGLLIGWRLRWRDTLLGMAVIYLFSPFLAARVESCWLPIPGAVPCFADNKVVLELASQLAHPIYYPVLIGLHLAGALFMWSLVASKGGHYAPSTGTTTD